MPFLIYKKVLLSVLLLVVASVSLACGHRSQDVKPTANVAAAEYAINVNTATSDELQRIPHIGERIAARIIEYREHHGPFRRVEHLMLIQGISDARFRKIRPLVRVE